MPIELPTVCTISRLGRTTVYAAINSGDLVVRKHGRSTIVLSDDIELFFLNLPTTKTSEADKREGRIANTQ
jgi:hypothetical protein